MIDKGSFLNPQHYTTKRFNFVSRIVYWNKQRYNQEYNSALTYSLLVEEVQELFMANVLDNDVDKVDALVDIIYVSVGALWKLGLNENQIVAAIQIVCDSNNSKAHIKTDPTIKANIDKGITFNPPEKRLKELLDGRKS